MSQISSDVQVDHADQSHADATAAKATVVTKSDAGSAGGGQDSAEETASGETLVDVDRETQADEKVAAESNNGTLVKQFEFVLKPQSLLLDIDERNAMVALWRVIGKTPRTLKRFVNVYRIIKAGLNAKEFEAFVGTGPSDAQYRAVLILLAVAYGAPEMAPAFFRALKNGNKELGLKEFLTTTSPSNGAESFQSGSSSLMEELNKFVDEHDVNISLAVLCEWLPVVVRYTFQHGSLSEEVAYRAARAVQA